MSIALLTVTAMHLSSADVSVLWQC